MTRERIFSVSVWPMASPCKLKAEDGFDRFAGAQARLAGFFGLALLQRLGGDLGRMLEGDDEKAVRVAEHDVAGTDDRIADRDRNVHPAWMALRRAAHRGARGVDRKTGCADFVEVPHRRI